MYPLLYVKPMQLFVFPVMLYVIKAVNLTWKQISELSLCMNNLYRRIFGLNKWESVKLIQCFVVNSTLLTCATYES